MVFFGTLQKSVKKLDPGLHPLYNLYRKYFIWYTYCKKKNSTTTNLTTENCTVNYKNKLT